ncbi:hypothetical protein FF011L_01700 [Roseimaritima multifibrata]|uniref:Uncharacterized protein n=1 Tax=Roseimaritima multifibrata TaxID=1930274 RepID=A0A517M974_9BACT|nr:hypothetical protein [Roseimaritima multifibrata]QDS91440.1 hypothetical protein FF011L_01700 [Roseimaritima multifibrata]
MHQHLNATQLIEIGDAVSASLEGMKVGQHAVSGSFIGSNPALNKAMNLFIKQTFEQATLDAGFLEIAPFNRVVEEASDRVNPECKSKEGKLWSIVAALGDITASLGEAQPSEHDLPTVRRNFIGAIKRESGLGEHAARETCDRFQAAIITAIDSVVGRQKS